MNCGCNRDDIIVGIEETVELIGESEEPEVVYVGSEGIPTKLSQLENDVPYATVKYVDDKVMIDELKIEIPKGAVDGNYLFSIDYSNVGYNYDYAEEYFRSKYEPTQGGACSSMRKGAFIGRNYDWYYDDSTEFIIRTAAMGIKHASVGVAQYPISKDIIAQRKVVIDGEDYSHVYKMIPFLTLDGINDRGVYCNTNVTSPLDRGRTTGTHTDFPKSLCCLAIVRYVLDYADSAADGITKLGTMNIWCPNSELFNEEMHFMIADENETYIVEFVDNVMYSKKVADAFLPIMTNFSLRKRYINEWFDGVYAEMGHGATPEYYADSFFKEYEHPMGVERYEILKSRYNDLASQDDMLAAMQAIKYTNSYSEDMSPIWYSEFTGEYGESSYGDVNWGTPISPKYEAILSTARQWFSERQRDEDPPRTWQTVHTSVYNLKDKSFWLYTQQDYTHRIEVRLDESESFWSRGTGSNSALITGKANEASGDYAVVEGFQSHADGKAAHAEGERTYADGNWSHAEGYDTHIDTDGNINWNQGIAAHAEGSNTTAQGNYSHAEGNGTVTQNPSEHAEGQANKSHHKENSQWGDKENTVSSIGIGNPGDPTARKNAVEVMQNGDVYILGVGEYNGADINSADTLQEALNNAGVIRISDFPTEIDEEHLYFVTEDFEYGDKYYEIGFYIPFDAYEGKDLSKIANIDDLRIKMNYPLAGQIGQVLTYRGNDSYGWMDAPTYDDSDIKEDIENISIDVEQSKEDIMDINDRVEDIEEIIPAQATAQNQLADKDFVNSTKQDIIDEDNKLSYEFISGAPSKLSDFENDEGFITEAPPEVHIGDDEPTDDEVLWIDTDDDDLPTDIATKADLLTREAIANRVNEITTEADNAHYPTAKAVKDFAETFEKPWERFRFFNPYEVDPTIDTSGITWYTDEENHIYGFEIDTDENGNPFAYNSLFMKVAGSDTAERAADFYINGVKIGAWHTMRVNLINRVGRLAIFRLGDGYEMAYHGSGATTNSGAWVNQASLGGGANFANGKAGKVVGKITKLKVLFTPENYFTGNFYIGIWGQK